MPLEVTLPLPFLSVSYHLPALFPWDPFRYYPPIYYWVFQVVSVLQIFRPRCCMHFSFLPCVLRARPSHPPWSDHTNNVWWTVQFMKLLITWSSPAPFNFLLGPNILLSALFSNLHNLRPSLSVTVQDSQVKLWFIHFNLQVFWEETGRQKTLNRIAGNILGI